VVDHGQSSCRAHAPCGRRRAGLRRLAAR
jgi:hypothetical protein